jgi:hypothetical protein
VFELVGWVWSKYVGCCMCVGAMGVKGDEEMAGVVMLVVLLDQLCLIVVVSGL